MDLFSLQQMQYISLPGEPKHLEISCEGSTSQEVPPQEVSPLEVSPLEVSPQEVSPQEVSPQEVSPQEVSPQEVSLQEVPPLEMSPQEVSPLEVSPQEVSPLEVSPLEVSPQVVSPPEVPIIYITSRPEQEPFRKGVGSATLCNVYRYIDCYKIYRNNMIFFVYSNISSYFPNQPASEDPNHSWMMANEFCKRIGSELLYFTQQEELDDFTTMLLEVRIFPFVEAVFIGLKYNELKVNLLPAATKLWPMLCFYRCLSFC